MSSLLNSETEQATITKYDRAYGGSFSNVYAGIPGMTFFVEKVKVQGEDPSNGTLLGSEKLPNVAESYIEGKVYNLINPKTGESIPGMTFTAEQFYSMVYSVFIAALSGKQMENPQNPYQATIL
jgi:hypothetical protein